MSFNLNKNDPTSGKAASGSKKSNFDLSKNDHENDQTTRDVAGQSEGKKAAYWLYALLALVVIGTAAWLLTNGGPGDKKTTADNAISAGTAATDTITADTTLAMQPADIGHERIATAADPDSAPVKREAAIDTAVAGNRAEQPQKFLSAKPALNGSAVNGTVIFAASFKAGAVTPRSTANGIPAAIRRKLRADGTVQVSVFGYASSEGDVAVNQTISQARADAYKKMLIQKGIAESSITATGRGIENPVASNNTESGRQKNRRVEVSF